MRTLGSLGGSRGAPAPAAFLGEVRRIRRRRRAARAGVVAALVLGVAGAWMLRGEPRARRGEVQVAAAVREEATLASFARQIRAGFDGETSPLRGEIAGGAVVEGLSVRDVGRVLAGE